MQLCMVRATFVYHVPSGQKYQQLSLYEKLSVCHNIIDQLLTKEVSIVSETEKLETE